jgi:hypothetical protein
VLARHALKRTSQGPLATRFGLSWTGVESADAAGRSAIPTAPISASVRRHIGFDLIAPPASAPKTWL